MNDATIRQAALALIDRKTGTGEWVNTEDVCRVLLGRAPTAEDWYVPPPPEKITDENVGRAWQIGRVLKQLGYEERLEYRGHYGWRRRAQDT